MSRRDFVFARGPLGGEAEAHKRNLGIAFGQNREQLLLRDGVCGGGNAGETDQTLRADSGQVGARNRDAGRRGFVCGAKQVGRFRTAQWNVALVGAQIAKGWVGT
jgi:hypothetical protein